MTAVVPSTIASAVGSRREITLRVAGPADDSTVRRLAALADRPVPHGAVLLAEVDGDVVAAADADSVVSDPFRVTLDVVELLRLRTTQLRAVA